MLDRVELDLRVGHPAGQRVRTSGGRGADHHRGLPLGGVGRRIGSLLRRAHRNEDRDHGTDEPEREEQAPAAAERPHVVDWLHRSPHSPARACLRQRAILHRGSRAETAPPACETHPASPGSSACGPRRRSTTADHDGRRPWPIATADRGWQGHAGHRREMRAFRAGHAQPSPARRHARPDDRRCGRPGAPISRGSSLRVRSDHGGPPRRREQRRPRGQHPNPTGMAVDHAGRPCPSTMPVDRSPKRHPADPNGRRRPTRPEVLICRLRWQLPSPIPNIGDGNSGGWSVRSPRTSAPVGHRAFAVAGAL